MDKVISADERIRRAEEIYYRRKMMDKNRDVARVNVGNSKRKFGLLKKTIIQILICIVIYLNLHLVQTTNYIFSQDVLNKTKDFLSYDIDFQNLYKNTSGYLNWLWANKEKKENEENTDQEETIETTAMEQSKEEVPQEEVQTQEILTQEEKDIKFILENVPMVKPLIGTITSRFGPRESDNLIVSKYHTGIDIAVNEGTSFVSAMDGTVKEVSSEGLYRSTCYY